MVPKVQKGNAMNRKMLVTVTLALLMVISLIPATQAQETLPFPAEWLSGVSGNLSIRDMIDETKETIEIAGSSFPLKNILFYDECVVNEQADVCLFETNEKAMVLDENSLPDGCSIEVRKEKVRETDAKNGLEVAEEIRIEKSGGKKNTENSMAITADTDKETYYLYLTGKPTKEGSFLFIVWDGTIQLCNIEVLATKPVAASDNTDAVTEEWTDGNLFFEEQTEDQNADNLNDSGVEDTIQQVWVDPNENQDTWSEPDEYSQEWVDSLYSSEPTPIATTPVPAAPTPQTIVSVPTPTPVYTPEPTVAPPVYTPEPTAAPPVYTEQPTFVLPTPEVYIAGSASVSTGEQAVLEARVNNALNPTYQWYTTLGAYTAPLQGQTSSQYYPDTSHAGTWTYFCRVTSNAYGMQTYADSKPVEFKVSDKTVTSINVETMPKKTVYYDGDAVDTTGLRLRVRYSDGSYDYATSGFIASPDKIQYNSSGTAKIAIYYKGFQTAFPVEVHRLEELIRGIGVLTMPNKTSYSIGETLSTAGLSIRVYSYDNRYLDIGEGFECSPTYLSSAGNQVITVSFGGKTCTFTVAVSEARRVYGLSVQSMPANRSYAVGDTINTAGLVLQVQTNRGTETVTSGYTISPRVATTAGTQQITVNYEGMSTSYSIDVKSNIPYATPTPVPYGTVTSSPTYGTVTSSPTYGMVTSTPFPYGTVTPTPNAFAMSTPTPTASPAATRVPTYSTAPTRRNTGVGTLVKVLFGVAVLSLCGLIGYVLYLRKHGMDDEDIPTEPRPSEKMHDFLSGSKRDRK